MYFESVLVGIVLIALIAAIVAKHWERQARRQYEAELNNHKWRRNFGRRKRKTKKGN